MVNIAFVEQLVNSMSESVEKLDRAISRKDFDEANRLRTFIFDLHLKIKETLDKKNV
ncbi:MAG: hypothetical protein ABIF88_01545 [archaeon]